MHDCGACAFIVQIEDVRTFAVLLYFLCFAANNMTVSNIENIHCKRYDVAETNISVPIIWQMVH